MKTVLFSSFYQTAAVIVSSPWKGRERECVFTQGDTDLPTVPLEKECEISQYIHVLVYIHLPRTFHTHTHVYAHTHTHTHTHTCTHSQHTMYIHVHIIRSAKTARVQTRWVLPRIPSWSALYMYCAVHVHQKEGVCNTQHRPFASFNMLHYKVGARTWYKYVKSHA